MNPLALLRRLPTWTPWALGAAIVAAIVYAWKPPEGGGGGSGGGFWGPPDPFNGAPVDAYAALESEEACDPSAKPGVLLFRQWVLDTWGERPGSPQNIVRGCDSGGASGHKQGKAWDQMTTDIAQGQAVVDALLATDAVGNPHALARRAGIRYMIWNKQMWRAYPYAGAPAGSWSPYTGGESAHTDHVHYSFSTDGADGLTSLYDAIRAGAPIA